MFERYTENARRVIFFARYEASRFGSESIRPLHVLLGIMREDKALVRSLLPEDTTCEEFRQAIETRLNLKETPHTAAELPLAAETKRVLAYAHEESSGLGHRHIGTEHLMLGLLREGDAQAAQFLSEQGLTTEALRESILSGSIGGQSHAGRPRASDNVSAGKGAKILKNLRNRRRVVLGLEKLLAESTILRGERVGLVCNQSSVDHNFHHAADLFKEHEGINLTVLFGPQHGIRGDVQDNMVETAHTMDRATGLPIYSLYSETREPTSVMLKDVDTLVFDMQDVGCRIYTFIYTLANCMRAAARLGKRVVVCDRPNPITGTGVEGNVLEPEFASFVGQFPMPTRHGMTVCELARLFKEQFGIGCELETVSMEGWHREDWMDETDAPWVMPSPNMPTLDTATVFPGTVHLEGTQMSEGRGTTRPFEIIGAPYIDAFEYAGALNGLELPGVYFRACGFQPTFQKHAGEPCGGVQIHVLERACFLPVMTGVATVLLARELYGEKFGWKEPPYEYVYDKNPFDVIAGTAGMRKAIERGDKLETIAASWQDGLESFKEMRSRFLLY